MAKTMVFIDSRVNDLDQLVSQFDAGTEYRVLDATSDGLLQRKFRPHFSLTPYRNYGEKVRKM